MSKLNTKISFNFAQLTDKGKVRKYNEDYMGNFEVPDGHLFVVCDGMGGHLGGAMAAHLGVDSIHQFFQKTQSDIRAAIYQAILSANQKVIKKAKENPRELHNMGATCVVVLIHGSEIFYGYAGDSRIYFLSDGKLNLLTRDHSYVQQLVDMQLLSPEEARYHPRRNEITSALGFNDIRITVSQNALTPQKGDVLLLCSDGLNNMVSEADMRQVMADKSSDVKQKAQKLVHTANQYGGIDNITVQLIQFGT